MEIGVIRATIEASAVEDVEGWLVQGLGGDLYVQVMTQHRVALSSYPEEEWGLLPAELELVFEACAPKELLESPPVRLLYDAYGVGLPGGPFRWPVLTIGALRRRDDGTFAALYTIGGLGQGQSSLVLGVYQQAQDGGWVLKERHRATNISTGW